MSAKSSFKDRVQARRAFIRAQVIPFEMRGILTQTKTTEHAPFLVWDLSETGLGLWSSSKTFPGEIVKLILGPPYMMTLTCEVMWCDIGQADSGYRCGVRVTCDPKKIEVLFETFLGCQEKLLSRPPELLPSR